MFLFVDGLLILICVVSLDIIWWLWTVDLCFPRLLTQKAQALRCLRPHLKELLRAVAHEALK